MHMRLKAVSWTNLGKLCIDSLGSGMTVYTVGQLHLQTVYGEQVSNQNGSCTQTEIFLIIKLTLFISLLGTNFLLFLCRILDFCQAFKS